MRTLRSLAVAAVALMLVPLTPDFAAADDDKKTKVQNFQVQNLKGKRVSLEDHLGQGPILIDFWATWCKPCIKALPHWQEMLNEYEDYGFQVLAVTIDTPRSQSQVKKFVKTRKYEFEVLLDGDKDVFRKCQGQGPIPYAVLLDSDGFIRYRHTGYRPGDEKEVEHEVRKLLAEMGYELGGDEEASVVPAAAEEAAG